jgi:Bacterial SH3 domain
VTYRVTASTLNLRDAPNGAVVGTLNQGAEVEVQAQQDGWAQVTPNAGGTGGWVAAQYLAQDGAGGMPVADSPQAPVTVVGGAAVGPDGQVFAHGHALGFYTTGLTRLSDWLQTPDAAGVAVSPSRVRVVRAVSANEGNLEAINTWDNSFLSFGLLQWTAGPDGAPGELAALVAQVKAADAGVFADCFGGYGLDVAVSGPSAVTGVLTLDGAKLVTAADKTPLRGADWAYRFWRAGHHPVTRGCQLTLAASRIDRFLSLPVAGQPLNAWLSSEQGIALILDEHVNRPGHVPGTLATALTAQGLTGADPSGWATADEASLIAAYLTARAPTSMTDSQKRADQIAACVTAGELSGERGSFAP